MKGNQESQCQTENRSKDFRSTERDSSNASRKETGLPRYLNEWVKDLRPTFEIASVVITYSFQNLRIPNTTVRTNSNRFRTFHVFTDRSAFRETALRDC